jgi:hypothetical protein
VPDKERTGAAVLYVGMALWITLYVQEAVYHRRSSKNGGNPTASPGASVNGTERPPLE